MIAPQAIERGELTRFAFTKARLDSLPLPSHGARTTYRDAKVPGLEIRVTSRGTKTFSVYRWMKSATKPQRVTLGTYPAMTIEQARIEAAKVNGKIAEGVDPAAVRRALRDEMTLSELFDEYLTRCAANNRRPDKPKAHYRLYLAQWGNRKLSQITASQVQALHAKLGRERGHVTGNVALKLLHVMFNKGINEWRIWKGENPAHGIKKFPERSRDRFVQSDELPRFFRAVAEEPNETMRDYFLMLLLTGARRANVLAMQWDQVNFERNEWRIPQTKNGEPQTVPLIPEAIEILRNRKPDELAQYVFPGSGKKVRHLADPKRAWSRLLGRIELCGLVDRIAARESWSEERIQEMKRAPYWEKALAAARDQAAELKLETNGAAFKDLRMHDLRRTMGSWQAATGASLSIIGKTLNHKTVSSTAIYARLSLDPVREAMQRATNAIFAAGGLAAKGEVVPIQEKRRA